MSLNYKVEMMASLELDENWIDDDAVEGLTLGEIKKLGMDAIKEDLPAFFKDAKWNVSVEAKPIQTKRTKK